MCALPLESRVPRLQKKRRGSTVDTEGEIPERQETELAPWHSQYSGLWSMRVCVRC